MSFLSFFLAAHLIWISGPGRLTVRPPAEAADTGTYYILRSDILIGRERYARSDTLLTVELAFQDQPRLDVRASLRLDATVRRLELRVFPADLEDTTLIQSSAATFSDGAVQLEQPIGTPAADTVQVPAGTLPFLSPSPSFIEQIVRRARVLGAQKPVRIWIPDAGGGRVLPVTVTFTDNGLATVQFEEIRAELAFDHDGVLLGAAIPARAIRIHRAPPPED